MPLQDNNQNSSEQKLKTDVGAQAFGVGDYPGYLLDFFNWGAFSQPFLWGVVYGVWPVVLVLLAADIVPYFMSYLLFSNAPESVQALFYSLIVQLLCTTIARIYAGMKANKLVWTRETMVVKMVREGKPRWDMNHYLSRQLSWAKYGMIFYGLASVVSAYVSYTALGATNQNALNYAIALPIVWFGASVAAGLWISKQSKVHLNSQSIVTETSHEFLEALQKQAGSQAKAFSDAPHYRLNSGENIPVIGFGTYKITDEAEAQASVKTALDAGYRLIDTASFYGNEEAVGRAIKESGLDRSEIFLTSKLWQDQQGYAGTILACEDTLNRLGVESLDLYLVHWPVESKLASTWKAIEHLMIAGKVKAIGVCNFEETHLEELKKVAHITPAVNQIELHPEFSRQALVEYCAKQGIQVEAWAPLARGEVFENETLVALGEKYQKSAGQIALRWSLQHGNVVIPKSTHAERIAQNFDVFDFEISEEDMRLIDGLNSDRRLGPDPQTFSWEWPKSSRN